MKCVIEINMDNDAFFVNGYELPEILTKLAGNMAPGYFLNDKKVILDSNGNKVGEMKITK